MKTVRRLWWNVTDAISEFWASDSEYIGMFFWSVAFVLIVSLAILAYGSFRR